MAEVYCGFKINKENVLRPFLKEEISPEEFHFEDRWDPKTGQKLKAIKIIDKKEVKSEYYLLNNERYIHGNTLINKITKDILFCEFLDSYPFSGFGYVIFYPKYGNASYLTVEDINELKPQLEIISEQLNKLGIEVSKAAVYGECDD